MDDKGVRMMPMMDDELMAMKRTGQLQCSTLCFDCLAHCQIMDQCTSVDKLQHSIDVIRW
jgi:hypothetical protein